MNIAEIQATLRHFAAERNWQPFHSPKNLTTALMVEAGELAEIFQWMTPEESRQAHDDVELKARIGEEIADVLLYLLQVADHTKVDLLQAVEGKLSLNARKYPPVRAIEPQPLAASRFPEIHALLDYENVQPSEEELRALIPDVSDVWVFHGPHQKQVDVRFTSFGPSVTLVPISKTGKNALDFHLSYYMGYITSRNPNARFVVIANDKGYDPMLEHAKELGFAVERLDHHRQPAVRTGTAAATRRAPSALVADTKIAAKEEVLAKKPAAKQAVAKKPATAKKVAAKAKSPPVKQPAKASAPAKKEGHKGAPTKVAANSEPGSPVTLTKIVDSLRKMGNKRPVKASSLRRTLKMLLGTNASDDSVSLSLNNLLAKGTVVIESTGDITYRL